MRMTSLKIDGFVHHNDLQITMKIGFLNKFGILHFLVSLSVLTLRIDYVKFNKFNLRIAETQAKFA